MGMKYRNEETVKFLKDKLKQNKIHKRIYAKSHDEMPFILMEEANYKRLLKEELSLPRKGV